MASKTTIRRYADELGALQASLAPLLAREKELKEALKAEGDGTYAGRDFEVSVATSEATTLDTKLVKGILTPAQITECSRTSSRTVIRVKARLQLAVAA